MSPLFGGPSLTVSLAKPEGYVYTPYDSIKGLVSLGLDDDTSIPSIQISFCGIMKTRARDAIEERDVSHVESLFCETKVLFQGPFMLSGGPGKSHSWRFDFHFPETDRGGLGWEFNQRGTVYFRGGGGWGADRLVLPPSCKESDASFARYEISYFVEAIIPKVFPVEARRDLWFEPGREERLLIPGIKSSQMCVKHSYRLDEMGAPQPCATRDRLGNIFSLLGQRRLPEAAIDFVLRTQDAIIIGEPFAISLQLKANLAEKAIPEFELRGLEATLKAITHVRAVNKSRDANSSSAFKIQLSRRADLQETLLFNSLLPLNDILPTSIPDNLAPSFCSVSVCRTYELKLRIVVVCLGKEFKLELRVPNMALISSRVRPTTRPDPSTPSVQAESDLPSERPPSYTPLAYGVGSLGREFASDRKARPWGFEE